MPCLTANKVLHHDDNIWQDVPRPAITILTLVQIKLQEQLFLWC